MDKKVIIKLALAIVLGLVVYLYDFGLPANAQTVLTIAVFAMVLWLTEVVPLHVTSLIVALLLVVFAKLPEKDVFAPFFDPVIVLLLGGFVLAVALQKHGLDKKLAYGFLERIGSAPKKFMLGIMMFTAFISFWVSNTATTATILPIAIAALAASKISKGSKYAKALILGVAYAATLGGMGTIIGSTPNVIVASFLAKEGIKINFVSWMYYAIPFTIIMIPVSWFVLVKMFKPEVPNLKVKKYDSKYNRSQKLVLIIFTITVILWMTDRYHGISINSISLVPIVLLYFCRLLSVEDFSKVEWESLVLFGGGLSLGAAIHSTGLDLIMANGLKSVLGGMPVFAIFLCVAAFGMILTAFLSNTVAASLTIPIMLPLSQSLGLNIKSLALLVALGVSVDLILPIGTPPGTMAYATGYIRIWDMVKSGVVISAIGLVILVGLALLYW
ncbi:SLC13/DASS family transporter [Candidatus Woesearchaeota archaeon]|nr:SLC13/DASS family transporter [Candidatus Woesearchaeota archaeon]